MNNMNMLFRSLPSEDTEQLKCALCRNYLSVPPITVISENGDDYKCGRCSYIKTEINIRNKIFENVLKHSKFQCIYKDCKEQLSWGDVEAHEQICPHRTIQCNMLEKCFDVIKVDDVETHYINKNHEHNWIVYEKFEKSIPLGLCGVYLFIKNKAPYFIYYSTITYDFWIGVYSLKSKTSENEKFEVKFSTSKSKGAGVSILYENGTVIPYNEREHCARCLFQDCRSPYHKFSRVNEKLPMEESMTFTYIDESLVAKTLKSDEFVYTINIMDAAAADRTDINKAEAGTVKEHSSNRNNNLLRQILQCPICMELMPADIHTCETGHIICSNCKPRLSTCPSCSSGIGRTRNFALEEVAEHVELACQYQEQGCIFIGNVAVICRHELQCPYKDQCSGS